jgi:hypothetical protein
MTGTEHYWEIVDLARQNATDSRNPIFKPLMDIDEALYEELWRWIKDFGSKRSVFSIICIFSTIRSHTVKLGLDSKKEVSKLKKVRAELKQLSAFDFAHYLNTKNIAKMLTPKSERMILTEHHLLFEATNFADGNLEKLRDNAFFKVRIGLDSHNRLHQTLREKHPEVVLKISQDTAAVILELAEAQSEKMEDFDSEKAKIEFLLSLLQDYLKQVLGKYAKKPNLKNSDLLTEIINLHSFIHLQTKWIQE